MPSEPQIPAQMPAEVVLAPNGGPKRLLGDSARVSAGLGNRSDDPGMGVITTRAAYPSLRAGYEAGTGSGRFAKACSIARRRSSRPDGSNSYVQ